MEGFSSNLNDTFTSTRGCAEPMFFPQHILPLLPLYNAQWWGYESLTAIALVIFGPKTQYLSQKFAISFAMLIYLVGLTYSKICDRL